MLARCLVAAQRYVSRSVVFGDRRYFSENAPQFLGVFRLFVIMTINLFSCQMNICRNTTQLAYHNEYPYIQSLLVIFRLIIPFFHRRVKDPAPYVVVFPRPSVTLHIPRHVIASRSSTLYFGLLSAAWQSICTQTSFFRGLDCFVRSQ